MSMRVRKLSWKDDEAQKQTDSLREVRCKRNKLSVCILGGKCAAMLLLLAIGGYLGMNSPRMTMVSSPVTARSLLPKLEERNMSMNDIRAELEEKRMQEIALLESVLANDSSSEEIKYSALAQKEKIALEMDTEAKVYAALQYMGFDSVAVICADRQLMIILLQEDMKTDEDSVRVIDASAAASGLDAKSVKIILTKK